MGYSCKGYCERHKVGEVGRRQPNYAPGRKYCSTCAAWMKYDGKYCPCCGSPMRTRAAKYKAQYRQARVRRI